LFPGSDAPQILKECQHDIRRVFHRLQYGESFIIPDYPLPPTGTSAEIAFLWRQKMFELPDPLGCHADKLGNVHLHQTTFEYNPGGKRVGNPVTPRRSRQLNPGKLSKAAEKPQNK
jgi:hypothetical protein